MKTLKTFLAGIPVVLFALISPAQSNESAAAASSAPAPFVIKSTDGKCTITIDTSRATNLTQWAETKLGPALAEWYPKIVAMLPSEGFSAPSQFKVTIAPGRGVAATSGNGSNTRITASASWMESQLNGEALGAIIHEEVHVVQQWGNVNKPGWLQEGIPDYIRFFLYEPQSHGADDVWLKRQRNFSRVNYDGAYRQSGNFLNWVIEKYDKDLVTQVNAAIREGKYTDEFWKQHTGKTAPELGA